VISVGGSKPLKKLYTREKCVSINPLILFWKNYQIVNLKFKLQSQVIGEIIILKYSRGKKDNFKNYTLKIT